MKGTLLVVQWQRLQAPSAESPGLIPDREIESPFHNKDQDSPKNKYQEKKVHIRKSWNFFALLCRKDLVGFYVGYTGTLSQPWESHFKRDFAVPGSRSHSSLLSSKTSHGSPVHMEQKAISFVWKHSKSPSPEKGGCSLKIQMRHMI